MKVIRKILNSNKRLFAFGLVLFLLFAGLSRSFAATKSEKSVCKKEQSSGSELITETDEAKCDEFKAFDCDPDDFECIGPDGFTLKKYSIPQNAVTPISYFGESQNNTLRLYDVFCNWKLHIA